jgi:hypothetical protein
VRIEKREGKEKGRRGVEGGEGMGVCYLGAESTVHTIIRS